MPDLVGGIRGRRHLGVLLLYVVLALGLSYPLVLHLSSHVPGSATWAFDEYTFVWNNWVFKEAALNLTSPLNTDLVFFPLGIDLILHTYNFFNAAISFPLQMVMGLAAASNLTLLLATVLSGYGTYLLTAHVLARAGSLGKPNLRFRSLWVSPAASGRGRRWYCLRFRCQPRRIRCARSLRHGDHTVAAVLRTLSAPHAGSCGRRWRQQKSGDAVPQSLA